jgi:hypothetical protein
MTYRYQTSVAYKGTHNNKRTTLASNHHLLILSKSSRMEQMKTVPVRLSASDVAQ